MCRDKRVPADEVLELGSSSESDASDVESVPEHDRAPVPILSKTLSQAVARRTEGTPPIPASTVTRQVVGKQTRITIGERRDSDSALMKLVTHLRSDNKNLHDALTQAQRSLEIVADNQAAREAASNIDFAHLLSLVKEFGDDIGGFESSEQVESSQACEDYQVFTMSSPREAEHLAWGDHKDLVCSGDDVYCLKKELEQARREVHDLRTELASKDAELVSLRRDFGLA